MPRRRDARGAGQVGMVGRHVLVEVCLEGVPFAAELARLGLGLLAPLASVRLSSQLLCVLVSTLVT